MSILNWISGLFKPVADLVDNVHTSTEEKLKLKNELATIQKQVHDKVVELEQTRLQALSSVEVAESQSTHWLRANWRPLSSLTLVGTILYLVFTKQPIPKEISDLAEIFLGAYAGGRSLEKIASLIKGG